MLLFFIFLDGVLLDLNFIGLNFSWKSGDKQFVYVFQIPQKSVKIFIANLISTG